MRILLAPSAYYPHVGGIEEATRQLALTLRSRGHDVSVLTNRWPEGVDRNEVLADVSITRLRFPLPGADPLALAQFLVAAPAAVLALVLHVRRLRPDVVHAIGAGPQAVYLGALVRVLGARLVFSAQGELTFDAHNIFERSWTMRTGLRRVLRVADAVTACSTFVLQGLSRVGPIRAHATVIPNGVNPGDFAVVARAVETRPYVLAVGRLVSQKGFDVLIDAFTSDELASLDLLIAGEGIERQRLLKRVSELGLANRVRFLGSVGRAEVAELLAGATIFVLPSRGEPFGIALLEAMAAGVPAVATRAGGVTDFARDGENAILVAPDDSVSLSRAIGRLAADRVLRSALIQKGRRTAEELAWEQIADRYEQLYLNVLAARRPAA